MNFSLYLYGTPEGYNQYPADSNSQLFSASYQKQQTDLQLTVFRHGLLVYYLYSRKLTDGNSSKYFGICLIFNGICFHDIKQLYSLFDKTYIDIVLKGEILKIDKVGKVSFATNKFSHKQDEVRRITLSIQNSIRNNFGREFTEINSSFKFGNGTKTLSLNDENKNILAAIQQYEWVLISNFEKTDSELDRIHKMINDLESEKQKLNANYKKLLIQKKQYKLITILCIAVLGCILGLAIFNKNLQSKESKIQMLKAELILKDDTILNQHLTIVQFQNKISAISIEAMSMRETINLKNSIIDNKTEEIDNKITEIQILNNLNSTLNSRNISYSNDIRDLKNQNQRLTLELKSTKNSTAKKYRVIVSKSFCYRVCAGNYQKNDCYYSLDAVLDVYTQIDGYGLTDGGYLKMSDLQKY